MEPNHNSYQPSAELPQPQDEAGLKSGSANEAPAAMPERAPQPPVAPIGQQPLQPLSAVPSASPPAAPPATSQSNQNAATTASLMADDVDLIEKEWVVKAKAIVAQTKDDPYQQNRAMTEVKADYLKKRYNKDLKVSNEG